MNREFYTCDGRIYCLAGGRTEEVTERDKEIIDSMFDRISNFYPEAMEALRKEYSKSAFNVPYYRFLIVSRFIRCNFGELDTTVADFDDSGIFSFEKVRCPLRGECPLEGVVCLPRFNTKLSKAELRVMELYYRNENIIRIADVLYLSSHTVKNHIRAAYAKLGIHTQAEFISYANRNHLFD